MVVRGYVVIVYDQVGFGMRLREGADAFYRRHATLGASLLGKMVVDLRAMLDTIFCFSADGRESSKCYHSGSYNAVPASLIKAGLPTIDYGTIVVAGYALGGTVALHAAALDDRIAAVASLAGFTPFRSDLATRPTGGLARLARLHALVPKLGLFVGNESAVPYDYGDLLAARRLLFFSPLCVQIISCAG